MTQNDFFERYSYNLDSDYLGGGGFGKVYRAFDDVLDRYVAIKIAEVKKGMEHLSLQKEVELTRQVDKHRNIANYEACFRFRTPHGVFDYGILQYYPEGNLSKLMNKHALSEVQKTTIAKGIIAGLKYLHKNDIVHRDLKSSNVLISKRQDIFIPKIADFGLSKQFVVNDQSYFSNSFAGGSLLYVAPEQITGEKIRKNVDIWGMGVILFELFTGSLPFYPKKADLNTESARQEIILQITSANLPESIHSVPAPWQTLIQKSLVVNTEERLRSVEAAEAIFETEKLIIEPSSKRPPLPIEDKTQIELPKPPNFFMANEQTKMASSQSLRGTPIVPPPIKNKTKNKSVWKNTGIATLIFIISDLLSWFFFTLTSKVSESVNVSTYIWILVAVLNLLVFIIPYLTFLVFKNKWKIPIIIMIGIFLFCIGGGHLLFQLLGVNLPFATYLLFSYTACIVLGISSKMRWLDIFIFLIIGIIVIALPFEYDILGHILSSIFISFSFATFAYLYFKNLNKRAQL